MSNPTLQLIELLQLQAIDQFLFQGQGHCFFGQRTYGGLLLAQALMAASHTTDRPAHSLHAYFICAGNAYAPVLYRVEQLRNGASLQTRQVLALQHGKVIFSALISFAIAEEGLNYQPEMPDYPCPDTLCTELQHRLAIASQVPASIREIFSQPFPIDIRPCDFVNPIHPQARPARYAEYLKTYQAIPHDLDQPHVHQAIIAFYSDYSLMNAALRPHALSYLDDATATASLDHSLYFHQPCRADEWMLYEIHATRTAHARGLNHGQMWQNGQLVCSTMQENLMRQYPSNTS